MFGARNRQNTEALVAIGAGDDGLHARQLLSFRYVDIKDFGTVLPGHGGALDRFDTFLFVLPSVYYLSLVVKVV